MFRPVETGASESTRTSLPEEIGGTTFARHEYSVAVDAARIRADPIRRREKHVLL